MILQGRNLIISANGKVIAGSRSCEINVQCDEFEIASPSQSQWREIIAGRKDWYINTNQLLPIGVRAAHKVVAVGSSFAGPDSYCMFDGMRYNGGTRGLTLRVFEYDSDTQRWQTLYVYTFDTYSDSTLCDDMAADINDMQTGEIAVITSTDAYALTSDLASAIANKLGIPLASISVMAAGRHSFACVGMAGWAGIATTNDNTGQTAHCSLLFDNNNAIITEAPVKSTLLSVGTMYTINVQVDELAVDRLTGSALCKQARVTGTLGNLMQGSFSWRGSGPLE